MDPLSNVPSLLKPLNYLAAGLDAGGDWAIQFPGVQQGIKTGAVVSGACWVIVEGVSEPIRLEAGDCFMLPSANRFRLASALDVPTVGAAEVFSKARSGGISTIMVAATSPWSAAASSSRAITPTSCCRCCLPSS